VSHEVVQVAKLITYNKKPHELISVTCKCVLRTIGKEMHKHEHSQQN